MKKQRTTRVCVCTIAAYCILSISGTASGQNNFSQSLNEGATISQPIRIYTNTHLNFGCIVSCQTANTVRVTGTVGSILIAEPPFAQTNTTCTFTSPNGSNPFIGSYSAGCAAAQVASFIVTGEPNMTFSISISGGSYIVSGGEKILLKLDPPNGIGINTAGNIGTLTNAGVCAFTVGGSLSVCAGQAGGTYSGSFSVLVCYN